MLALVAATLVAEALTSASSARADWLRVLPSCAQQPFRDGHAHLHYPRPGLPAVAHAGDELRLRVELPLALTPAPGIQQPRALLGWQAQLSGRSPAAEGNARIRFAPRIRGIHPIDRHTGIYEVVLGLSPAMPPGTYDVRITPPWVSPAFTEASLRIIDGPARLARWDGTDAPPDATFEHGEVDVWLSDGPLPGAGPWLDKHSSGAVFEVHGQALVLGGCDDAHRSFASLRRETSLPSFAGPWPPPSATPPILHRSGTRLLNRGSGSLRFPFPFPEDGRGRPHPRALGYFPGTSPRPGAERASIVALIGLGPGESFAPPRAAALSATAVELRAEGRSARGFRLAIETSLPGPHRVAYFWEEDSMHWGPSDEAIDIEATSIGTLEAHALLIGPAGEALRTQSGLRIQTESPQGCAAAPETSPLWWAFLGTILVARYKRRRPNGWVF